jgi:hypothetical protein
MIKFYASDKSTGAPVLGIGLTPVERKLLTDGGAVSFETDEWPEHHGPVISVMIFGCKTESEMAQRFLDAGAITSEQVHYDPRLIHPADTGLEDVNRKDN